MSNIRILVIDDDPHICDLITLYGEKNGYSLTSTHTGYDGLQTFFDQKFDLVILDIMLPEIDGWEICQSIRLESDVPIIMLTGRGESYDRIKGFDLGADDYVVKPFDPKELMARVRAVLKRSNPYLGHDVLIVANLRIDINEHKVMADSEVLVLPPKETELLYYLASRANHVFTRQQLVDQIWGFDYEGDPRTVDVHIKRLREKLVHFERGWSLKTIRGIGYKFEVSE